MARLRLPAGIALLAAALWLVVGHGLVNYDTLYSLVWGRDLAHGRTPDYGVSLAPTPHPLATFAGLLVSPLSSWSVDGLTGQAGATLAIAGAFVALGLLGWVVYRIGAAWFNPWAGALAALLIVTRQPVLDYGSRVYVDVPYLVLVLGALLVETRRPRAGAPVLALLAVAGLIRPEAWLFSGAYLVWLWAGGVRDPRLVALAAAGPLLWLASDWAITGNPLHSLTGTRDTAETLGRKTGLRNVPLTVPRRIGEIVREPVLLGAVLGGAMSLLWFRHRTGIRTGIATGLLALVAFCALAASGLPILGRYLLLPATLFVLFAAGAAFGWMELRRDDPRRRWWVAAAVVTGLALVAFAPAQVNRIVQLRHALARQTAIQGDLEALIRHDGPLSRGRACPPIAVPNHRPVPLLALWLDLQPKRIVSAQERGVPPLGTYVTAASPAVAKDYVLDKRDPSKVVPRTPSSYIGTGGNGSWTVSQHCAPDVHVDRGE